MNLADLVCGGSRDDLSAITYIEDSVEPRAISRGSLAQRAKGIARGLARSGYPRGIRIAIVSHNHPDCIAAFLGIVAAGAIACPVNFKLSHEMILTILRDADVSLVFGEAELLAGLDGFPRIAFGEQLEHWIDPGEFASVSVGPEDIACLMYTSGSTGTPKGVPITHLGYGWALRMADPVLLAGRRTLVAAPLYHMNGHAYALTYLCAGAELVLMRRFSPRGYAEAIDRFSIFEISGVPTMLALLDREIVNRTEFVFTSVRSVSLGSAPLTSALADRIESWFPNAVLDNGYGTTESGPISFGAHPGGKIRPKLSLGYPLPGVQVALKGGAGADDGVLWIRTPATARGYWNRPEASREKFLDGWYNTGDLMRRDAEGFYFFVGRIDDMFNCGGENLYPAEIERRIERHPAVEQAVVVPVSDPIKGQVPVAFVKLRASGLATSREVKEFALSTGPAFAHPRKVFLVENYPLATTNKVDRRALRNAAEADTYRAGFSET